MPPKTNSSFVPSYLKNPPFPYTKDDAAPQGQSTTDPMQNMTNSYYPYPPKRITEKLNQRRAVNGYDDEEGKFSISCMNLFVFSFSTFMVNTKY